MKSKSYLLSAAIAVTLVGCQSTIATKAQPQMSHHASQGVYQVEFAAAQKLSDESAQLMTLMEAYCTNIERLETVKAQWHRTMLAWMALQGQERGPEAALTQSWNIQFWPDKKNITGRKMSQLIKQDKTWSQAEIASQSVTVQGLGAIEWLFYDPASNLIDDSQTCDTAQIISENISANASKIATAWRSNPWLNLDDKQWSSEYVSLLVNQLEYSMKKLSRPLAKFGQPRPYFAESWRAQTSMDNLKANIEAMQMIYFANGKGLDALLRSKGKVVLANSIANQFAVTLSTWPTQTSLFELLQTKQGYQNAYAQYNKLAQLKYLIHEEVAVELGVIIGFNATDGD